MPVTIREDEAQEEAEEEEEVEAEATLTTGTSVHPVRSPRHPSNALRA